MKSRIVTLSLVVLVAAVVAWSASGTSVEPASDDQTVVPAMDKDRGPNLELEMIGGFCASTPEISWSEVDYEKVESYFNDLDELVNGAEEDQTAALCPPYFFAPTTCSGCLGALNQCLEGELLPALCYACYEVCLCNRGCCH